MSGDLLASICLVCSRSETLIQSSRHTCRRKRCPYTSLHRTTESSVLWWRGEHVLERTRVALFRDGCRMGVCSLDPRDGWPPRHLRKAACLNKARAAVAGEARVRPLRSLRRQRGFGGVERLLRLIRALRAGGRRARLDRLPGATARSGRQRLGPSVCGAACPFVDTCLRVCGAPQLPRDSAGLVADTARAHQSVFLCYAKNPTVVSLSSGLYTCSACGTARVVLGGYGGKPYTC